MTRKQKKARAKDKRARREARRKRQRAKWVEAIGQALGNAQAVDDWLTRDVAFPAWLSVRPMGSDSEIS